MNEMIKELDERLELVRNRHQKLGKELHEMHKELNMLDSTIERMKIEDEKMEPEQIGIIEEIVREYVNCLESTYKDAAAMINELHAVTYKARQYFDKYYGDARLAVCNRKTLD